MSLKNRAEGRVSSIELEYAFKKLRHLLGNPIAQDLLDEMSRQGIHLSNESLSYSLDEIQDALEEVLGTSGASLVMAYIRKVLRD